jgi:hypothetical protein
MPPYIYSIEEALKEGENKFEIEYSTTLFNLLGPGYINGVLENMWVGPYTFIDEEKMKDTLTLLPYGISGISIVKEKI